MSAFQLLISAWTIVLHNNILSEDEWPLQLLFLNFWF